MMALTVPLQIIANLILTQVLPSLVDDSSILANQFQKYSTSAIASGSTFGECSRQCVLLSGPVVQCID